MNNKTLVHPRVARRPRGRRGIALVLVIAAIAIAAVLGYALLSGGMLQTRTSGNAIKVAQADYLAESGLNLALLYLQYPDKAPSRNASGYWGGGDFTVGSTPPQSISVAVQRDATDANAYEISSTGKVGAAGEAQMTRTLASRVNVQTAFRMKSAIGASGSLTVYGGTTIEGDVASPNAVTLKAGASVTGKVLSPLLSLPLGFLNPPTNEPMPLDTIAAPAPADVNRYATYALNGAAGAAETIPSTVTSLPDASVSMNASGNNPGKVWVAEGNLTLNNNFVLDGTLVVKGNLTINGNGITVTPRVGMPGLVVIGNLTVNQPRKVATVNGAVYVGNQLKVSGVLLLPADASILNINGGLLMGGATPIAAGYNVTTKVKLDPAVAKAPDLSTTGRSPMSVSVKRWGPKPAAPYTVASGT